MSKKQNKKNNISNEEPAKPIQATPKLETPIIEHKTTAPSVPFTPPAYLEYVLLAVLALVYLVVRKNFWEIPMERDEGIYAYFGQLILDGSVPYLDFYEHRLPGIFYMYAILVGIFGTFKGLAAGITVLNIGSLLFIYFFSRNWFNHKPTAFIITITAAILGLAPEISGFTRQSEHIVVFWAAGGFYFLLQAFQTDKWKYLVWSGVFMCLAMLTKPNGVFFIVLGGAWVVFYYFFERGQRWTNDNEIEHHIDATASESMPTMAATIKKMVAKAGIYSVAVFGTFGIMCLIMLMQGALDDMFYWSVTYSSGYVARIPMGEGFSKYFMPTLQSVTANYMLFWAVAFVGLILVWFVKDEKAAMFKRLGLWMLVFFSFLTITPSFSFYGHYWIMFVPSIAFAFGAALNAIYQLAGRANSANMGIIGVFFILLAMHVSNIGNDKSLGGSYYMEPKFDKILRKTYGGNPFPEAFEISKYIKSRLQPTDQIALIGSEPELFIYTGARSVSKHAYFSYLMNDTTGRNEQGQSQTLAWQEEFRQDVETKKPKIIVFFNHDISILPSPNTSFTMVNTMLSQYIPQHYRVIGVVDLVGTPTPRYILNEQQAPTYQFAQAQNGQRIWTILIYELLPQASTNPPVTPNPQ